MKIAYVEYRFNPKKPELIPHSYPWHIKYVKDDYTATGNEIVVTEEAYALLLTSFEAEMKIYQDSIAIEKDIKTMSLRAASIDNLLNVLAAENKARVRSGEWTTEQLISVTNDMELKAVFDDISQRSFELAILRLQKVTNPLITAEIKADWISKISSNLYLS